MAKPKFRNFLLCFISSLIVNALATISYSFAALTVYFVSDVYHANENSHINIQYALLMLSIFIMTELSCFPIAGPIDKKIGGRLTMILGCVSYIISSLLFLYVKNIFVYLISSVILGFGYGMLYSIPLRNCTVYYPKYKGTIISIFEFVGPIAEIFFVYMGEKMINPHMEEADENIGFYPKHISDNCWTFHFMVIIAALVIAVVGGSLYREYDPNVDEVDENDKNLLNSNDKNKELVKSSEPSSPTIKRRGYSKIYYENLKECFTSKRFWLITILGCLVDISSNFTRCNSRTFGTVVFTSKGDGKILTILSFVCTLGYGLTSILWGLYFDYYGYKKAMRLLILVSFINSVLLVFFLTDRIMFLILVALAGSLQAGHLIITTPHYFEVFSLKYLIEINGVGGIIFAIERFLFAQIGFVFGFYFKTGKELIPPYKITYIVFSVICVLALFMSFFDSPKPFRYSMHEGAEEEMKHEEEMKQIAEESK